MKKNNFISNLVSLRRFSPFVMKGDCLNVLYKSKNVIIHLAKEGTNNKLVIYGSGYSANVDNHGIVTDHDPFMVRPNMKPYGMDVTVMSVLFPFETEGLESAGKEMAQYINTELSDKYDEIVLIGHSKCGVMFANEARHINKTVTIVTISAPFEGTIVTDKELFERKANKFINLVYGYIFSNRKVDKDVACGSQYIAGCVYDKDALCTRHKFINVVSICPKHSLNPIDAFLIYLDKKVSIRGDGIAPRASQECIHYRIEGTILDALYIEATHASSLNKALKILNTTDFS